MIATVFGGIALGAASPASAADPNDWDRARAALVVSQPTAMTYAVDRWKQLSASDRFTFADYSSFVLSYPNFPDEEKLRRYAEGALDREYVDAQRLVSYFDRRPPLTNPARAQYALALRAMGRPEASTVAHAAWRGGPMSDTAEAMLFSQFGATFTPDDHDARMDALLWAGSQAQAQRQLGFVSPAQRAVAAVRLAALSGIDPALTGIQVDSSSMMSDPGYLFQRVRQYRKSGNGAAARSLLANRGALSRRPVDVEKWVDELLVNARSAASSGDPRTAVRIASKVDDAFEPGTDISQLSLGLRDDYTSLVWLGGTEAMWDLGDPVSAAPLFYRYGNAAKTPQTRSKGFYWAGLASDRARDPASAQRYFQMAANYGDQFYGQLALERLGRPIPTFATDPTVVPTPAERQAFASAPLTAAVREVARASDWRTAVKFFRQISDNAQTAGDHVLVAELARNLGRRDLGVILGQSAATKGFLDFQHIAFPRIQVPLGYDSGWTMIHAIARQESQFAQNAVSHAGARGLMQLMPGTAREQAGKIGLSYAPDSLIADPNYNMQLGSSYFGRMMDYFGGSYPLAVAAYNAGAGNVNKWLAANGDPRTGSISWVDWIERIPIYETKNYVQRVIENAVVYEAMNPDKATYRGPNPTSHFLGKRTPG
ncbi:transglycosylase SLT domain-containing protein [Novosphingobium tardum]|uniref:Transglycosylase SLT domain-containing protein n=1 Tax=Novosphingobium tardum TaxID=1538021 RepID=A0ABV8RRY8_9SPHN